MNEIERLALEKVAPCDSSALAALATVIEGEIPRMNFNSSWEFEQHLRGSKTPVILTNKMIEWPAMKLWNLEYFRETYGNVSLPASINLPDKGAVYDQANQNHHQMMKLEDIVDLIKQPNAKPCYTHQRPISFFPSAERDVNFEEIVPPHPRHRPSINLWIGSKGTRSGLHFDRRDNLLGQIQGQKWVLCCPPEERSKLNQFRRNIDKSKIDVENMDLNKQPQLKKVRMWHAILQPGELLFIPRMWWHFVRSLDPSISINFWFGPTAPWNEQIPAILSAGPLSLLVLTRDFIWNGILGRPHKTYLHTGRPSGAYYYDKIIGWRLKR
ncbi:lysine-specific demethylase 8 [Nitrosospira multiformis]|uniref:Lysine-specific demethylase 8 n=1 Tax=Nitrosospira multiformis TaxID=1231 RepID=A0A1H8NM83_9PROT|nr:cupin-like domain-containing protein [Nitrosospira multiformis]SEO30639.1 lysine-specific demethylase 8 [Nitrosospira multiformis]